MTDLIPTAVTSAQRATAEIHCIASAAKDTLNVTVRLIQLYERKFVLMMDTVNVTVRPSQLYERKVVIMMPRLSVIH